MDWLEILLLAVVQGLTEFLPVSSSGHLVIVDALLFGDSDPADHSRLAVTVLLHAGTLLSVLLVYRRQVAALLGQDRRVIGLLAVGTLPAAVVGLTISLAAPGLVESPLLAGCMLLVTAGLLWWGGTRPPGQIDYREMRHWQALVIGLVQAAAVLPGLSRSGSTIVAGLGVGLKREAAATFSFLLSIPVIAGAVLLHSIQLASDPSTAVEPAAMLAGVAVSFGVGVAALCWLLRWLNRGRLWYFAVWCLLAGVAVLAWQLELGRFVN